MNLIPLNLVAFCVDCQSVFNITLRRCPGCAGDAFFMIAHVLNRAEKTNAPGDGVPKGVGLNGERKDWPDSSTDAIRPGHADNVTEKENDDDGTYPLSRAD